jgi:hypothetical protein
MGLSGASAAGAGRSIPSRRRRIRDSARSLIEKEACFLDQSAPEENADSRREAKYVSHLRSLAFVSEGDGRAFVRFFHALENAHRGKDSSRKRKDGRWFLESPDCGKFARTSPQLNVLTAIPVLRELRSSLPAEHWSRHLKSASTQRSADRRTLADISVLILPLASCL